MFKKRNAYADSIITREETVILQQIITKITDDFQLLDVPVKKLRVLVLDDVFRERQQIICFLSKIAFLANAPEIEFIEGENAEAGLELLEDSLLDLEQKKYDLIITDIEMPGLLDGLELIERLRKKQQYKPYHRVPAIVISNYVYAPEQRINAYLKGGYQVISKENLRDGIKKDGSGQFDYDNPSEIALNMAKTLESIIDKKKIELLNKELYKLAKIMNYQNKKISDHLEYLKEELDFARDIQCILMPRGIAQIKNLRYASIFKPMFAVGGDFFDIYYNLDFKDKVGIFISDVSGHGLKGVVISAMIKMALNSWSTFISKYTPAQALEHIKKQLKDKLHDNFFTAYLGMIDLNTGMFTFARAGHPPLLIVTKASGYKDIKMINSRGQMIGDADFIKNNFEDVIYHLDPGDKIILYSDGLTEAENSERQMLGIELNSDSDDKTMNFFRRIDYSMSPRDICKSIKKEFGLFTKDTPLKDDLTVLVLEYTPGEPQEDDSDEDAERQ